MPTLIATPWPSGPVVASTPDTQWYSGCPGALEPSWRKRRISSSVTDGCPSRSLGGIDGLGPRQVKNRPEQHGCVPVRQHEAIAIGPDRILRIEAHHAVPDGVDER